MGEKATSDHEGKYEKDAVISVLWYEGEVDDRIQDRDIKY